MTTFYYAKHLFLYLHVKIAEIISVTTLRNSQNIHNSRIIQMPNHLINNLRTRKAKQNSPPPEDKNESVLLIQKHVKSALLHSDIP